MQAICRKEVTCLPYFNYHATVRRLLAEGKLVHYYFTENHRGIRPALVLIFADEHHPVMPIRAHRFAEYLPLLPPEKKK